MNNPAYYDVATLLNSGLSELTLGDNLFGGEWSAGKDDQVLCLQGVSVPTEMKDLYEQPAVQILVRGKVRQPDYAVYRLGKKIRDFLLQQSECVTINNVDYKGFEVDTELQGLGKDENERFVYTMSFYSWRNAFS